MERLETLLSELAEDVARAGAHVLPKTLDTLDARLAQAVQADAAGICGDIFSALGQIIPHGKPSGFRTACVCTMLGHVQYVRAYYAPAREPDARRALRRQRGGACARKGAAPCACPLDHALRLLNGMTPAMRDRVQRAAAFSGSFAEGAMMLRHFAGVSQSESTFRRNALAAGERAVAAQEFPAQRLLTPFWPARRLAATVATQPTLYIMLDGTGVPCVKKDTEGVKGKGPDGKAGTREVKVGVVGSFRRLDAKGRPLRDPGCESHIVSAKPAEEFGTLLRRLANSRGYSSDFRIQIVGDGADWIENIVKHAFPGADINFTVDFYHACEYVQAFLARVGINATATAKAYKMARSILRRFGANTLIQHLLKRYPALKTDAEAANALAYISKRKEHMRYDLCRKHGYYIGSGIVEAACRTDVARRCKQSGMHWRYKNAAAMCALVARFRSNLDAA